MFAPFAVPAAYSIPAVELPMAARRRRARAKSCKHGRRKNGRCRKTPRRGRR